VLSACHAALDYAYPWDGLIARWKFQGDLGLNSAWHGMLAALPLELDAIDAVLPIPLSPTRLAERGYNQAWELAKGLLQGDHRHKGWPQALVRLAEVPDQHRLSAAERRVNLRGVFGVHPDAAARVHNARLLLVDDVMTTGATLSEAATTLLNAGACSVSAVVLARTPPA
jgi:ComF family protein